MTDADGDDVLDTRGLRCPLPVLKLRKRLQTLPDGARVAMLADDPAAWIDVPHFCAEQGHVLIAQEETALADGDGAALRFIVEKAGG